MIRKWFSGVFRPDRLETDSVHTEQVSIGQVGITVDNRTTPTDVNSDTVTKVQFDTVRGDTGGPVQFDAENNKVDVMTDGMFALTGVLYWDSDATWSSGDRVAAIVRVNGATETQFEQAYIDPGEDQSVGTSMIIRRLNEGDEIDLNAYQESGDIQTVKDQNWGTAISVAKIG